MTHEQIIQLIAVSAGIVGLVVYVWLILIPAWNAYWRVRERVAAAVLSLYVVAGFVLIGAVGGVAVIWFWDRFTG